MDRAVPGYRTGQGIVPGRGVEHMDELPMAWVRLLSAKAVRVKVSLGRRKLPGRTLSR